MANYFSSRRRFGSYQLEYLALFDNFFLPKFIHLLEILFPEVNKKILSSRKFFIVYSLPEHMFRAKIKGNKCSGKGEY